MPKKLENWKPTCNRFVAFLDIMGFRDMVFRESHKSVKRVLESFQPTVYEIEKEAKRILAAKTNKSITEYEIFGRSFVRPVLFSDSIILFSSDDLLSSVHYMFFTIQLIFEEAVRRRIPMKGAVAYGEQTANFDKSLHFGQPLIDAYELQNQLQLYGVALHHTMEKHIKEIGQMDYFEDFILYKWPTPMSSGQINHYLVDWSFLLEEESHIIELIPRFYDIVSGAPRKYVDNTLDFARWLDKRKTELAQKEKSPSKPSKKRGKSRK